MRITSNKLDYVGFTFNGTHSSLLGILSVSNGSRYERDLLPNSQDYTMEIQGGEGSHFFGNNLKGRNFSINFAFDDVTELELREIAVWLDGGGLICPLIFDERPYIQYYVKVTGQPSFSYVSFDNDGERLYKGEGNVNFISYDPYGYSVYKWLDSYSDANKTEWSTASGFKANNEVLGSPYYDVYASQDIPLYNAGDVSTDFVLTFLVAGTETVLTISLDVDNTLTLTLVPADLDAGTVTIDTKKRLIKHVGAATTIINYMWTAGNFFKIPVGLSTLSFSTAFGVWAGNPPTIEYSYKFL